MDAGEKFEYLQQLFVINSISRWDWAVRKWGQALNKQILRLAGIETYVAFPLPPRSGVFIYHNPVTSKWYHINKQ
jgi:hypothetical protein